MNEGGLAKKKNKQIDITFFNKAICNKVIIVLKKVKGN